MPARQSTDGDSRFGEKFLGVRFHHHHGVAYAGSQDRAKIGHWQDFKRRSNEHKSHVDTERGKKSLASFDAFSKQTVYARRKMAR
jgi:hypothetical protein